MSRRFRANPMLPQSWSRDLSEALFVFNQMLIVELQYFSRGHDNSLLVTPKGWIALEAQPNTESTNGFVAMWFDDSVRPLFTEVIEPAIVETGYEPLRIDNKEHTNKIDDEIVASIRASRFVVADYTAGDTGARGGVYYEAGLAHGLGLPVIFMAREGTDLHFDIRQYNTIFWKTDNFADARERLKNRILATLGHGPLKTT